MENGGEEEMKRLPLRAHAEPPEGFNELIAKDQ